MKKDSILMEVVVISVTVSGMLPNVVQTTRSPIDSLILAITITIIPTISSSNRLTINHNIKI